SYGLKVPKSVLVEKKEDFEKVKVLRFPLVLKAQVLVGGRMKAGGVLFSNSFEETQVHLSNLIGSKIRGELCQKVLVEEVFPHNQEDYLSVVFDRNEREVFVLYSPLGGINIEENRESIERLRVEDLYKLPERVVIIAKELIKIFFEKDLTLLEINPIGYSDSDYCILDCVMHVDDSALYRQTWCGTNKDSSFSESILDGNVGIIGCGAGLVMATFDALISKGLKVGFFADLGGGATFEDTMNILNKLPKNIDTVVFNIFGGITDSAQVARAILEFKNSNENIKVLVRITGNNEENAKKILNECGVSVMNSTIELVNTINAECENI
ncbi:MAG: ATP-grasp domain-containing protein, partial [Fervidobacterium pennivorans]